MRVHVFVFFVFNNNNTLEVEAKHKILVENVAVKEELERLEYLKIQFQSSEILWIFLNINI